MTASTLARLADRVRPLRRIEYDRLVAAGLLENEKVELIRGLIVRVSPQGARHASVVQRLTHLFVIALAASGRAAVRVQLPLAVGDDSEPEPDVAIVPPGAYEDEHPSTAFLVIEVGDSSLARDRDEKAALYAEAGIPEYWVVDAARELVEVHSDVVDGGYARVTPYRRGETIIVDAFPDLRVTVDNIFE